MSQATQKIKESERRVPQNFTSRSRVPELFLFFFFFPFLPKRILFVKLKATKESERKDKINKAPIYKVIQCTACDEEMVCTRYCFLRKS